MINRLWIPLLIFLVSVFFVEAKQVSSKDIYNNETVRVYDKNDRVIKIIYPSILDENDNPVNPTFRFEYDALGNVISTIDPKGYVTKVERDTQGRPLRFIYPDGSMEQSIYDDKGFLIESIAKNGTRRCYSYDPEGRVSQAIILSSEGVKLNTLSYNYEASLLVSTEDDHGLKVSHEYDENGSLIKTTEECPDGCRMKGFVYDEIGHLSGVKEWFDLGENQYSFTTTERNVEEKIAEVRVEDANGIVLKCEDGKSAIPERCSGNATIRNSLGQIVKREIEAGVAGDVKEIIYNVIDKPETISHWNEQGQLVSQEEIRYDANGNKVRHVYMAFKDGIKSKSYELSWTYGPMDRLEAVTESGSKRSVCEYNQLGQRISLIKADGVKLGYEYNEMGLLAKVVASDGSLAYEYRYDAYDHLVSAEDILSHVVTTREYSPHKELKREILANGLKVSSKFDGKGRRTKLVLPDGSYIHYEYNSAYLTNVGRFNSAGEELYHHSYTGYSVKGHLTDAQLIGDLGIVEFRRDDDNHCIAIQSPYWNETIPAGGFDYKGNLIALYTTDIVGTVMQTFSYDCQQQLLSEEGLVSHEYEYDALFNRVSKDKALYETNSLNQILEADGILFSYDANGNRILKSSDAGSYTYSYDALNRLKKVVKDDNTVVEYVYDPFNRRIGRKVYVKEDQEWKFQQETRFLFDGMNEIGAVDEEGKIIELRVLGDGRGAEIGAAVAVELVGEVFAPIHDHRGSVVSLVNMATGTVAECYRYSAFGDELIFDGNGQSLESSAIGNPWRFSSKRFDEITHLVGFGKRDYDPGLGVWLTPDPLGNIDAPNLYAFVQNNPLMRTDLHGFFSFIGAIDDFLSTIANAYNSVKNKVDEVVNAIGNELTFLNYLADDLDQVAHRLSGKAFLILSGYYDDYTRHGIYGQKEISNKVRVTLINGMLNNHDDCTEIAELISKSHGNVNVHYICHATEGWTRDIFHGAFVKFGYISPQARLLAATWKRLIADMGGVEGGGTIVHYAHSLGGTDTTKARSLLTEAEQKMIKVYTFGSSTIVPNDGFNSVTNYVSVRDGICWLDPVGYVAGIFNYNRNVQFVGSIVGIPLVDHLFSNDTYRLVCEELGRQFCTSLAVN